MPSFKFNDAESRPDFIPAGDYIAKIIATETGISRGAKTAGSETISLRLEIEGENVLVFDTLIFHRNLLDNLACFSKSMGIDATKGQEVEIDPDEIIGLRGWVALKVEEYPVGSGNKRNRVRTYLTDRELLEPDFPEPVEEDDPFADEDDGPNGDGTPF